MLTEDTALKLSAMKHRADAKRGASFLPLSGIVWDDEMPIPLFPMPDDDRKQICRLFGLRVNLWREESLAHDDLLFWEELRAQVPEWAFFHRQTVTADDMQMQDEIEKYTDELVQAFFFDGADKVTITEENGVQSFSATFDLRKGKPNRNKKSFLRRILDRWR